MVSWEWMAGCCCCYLVDPNSPINLRRSSVSKCLRARWLGVTYTQKPRQMSTPSHRPTRIAGNDRTYCSHCMRLTRRSGSGSDRISPASAAVSLLLLRSTSQRLGPGEWPQEGRSCSYPSRRCADRRREQASDLGRLAIRGSKCLFSDHSRSRRFTRSANIGEISSDLVPLIHDLSCWVFFSLCLIALA